MVYLDTDFKINNKKNGKSFSKKPPPKHKIHSPNHPYYNNTHPKTSHTFHSPKSQLPTSIPNTPKSSLLNTTKTNLYIHTTQQKPNTKPPSTLLFSVLFTKIAYIFNFSCIVCVYKKHHAPRPKTTHPTPKPPGFSSY